MTVTLATVTGTFPAGTASTAVRFTPSSPVNIDGAPELLGASPVKAQVVNGALKAADGTSALQLPVTSQGTPVGATGFWFWTVTNLPGIPPFSFFLTADSDLTDLVNSPASGPGSGVSSFNTRTGAVTPQSGDYSSFYDATGAAATAESNAQAFATSAVGTETTRALAAEALLAPLASPALTGNPTAPTQGAGNNSTRLATTAYADSSSSTAAAGKVNRSGDTMTGYVAPAVVALTDGSSVALNAALGNDFRWTLGASSHTLAAPSNPVNGQSITIAIKYSGSFTPLFNSVYDFGANGAPSWTATSGKTDYCGFRYDSALNGAAGAWAYMGSVLGLTS